VKGGVVGQEGLTEHLASVIDGPSKVQRAHQATYTQATYISRRAIVPDYSVKAAVS
jgi:hypothetical protein